MATISDLPFYNIFVPQNFFFWKFLMTSLNVICGLGLSQSKILGTPMNWRSPEKLFWKPFFENTCACVLGPWLWPRASLSLASRGPVLGKAVLGLGLGFFLCPWPQALYPRLHLWYVLLLIINFSVIIVCFYIWKWIFSDLEYCISFIAVAFFGSFALREA